MIEEDHAVNESCWFCEEVFLLPGDSIRLRVEVDGKEFLGEPLRFCSTCVPADLSDEEKSERERVLLDEKLTAVIENRSAVLPGSA